MIKYIRIILNDINVMKKNYLLKSLLEESFQILALIGNISELIKKKYINIFLTILKL